MDATGVDKNIVGSVSVIHKQLAAWVILSLLIYTVGIWILRLMGTYQTYYLIGWFLISFTYLWINHLDIDKITPLIKRTFHTKFLEQGYVVPLTIFFTALLLRCVFLFMEPELSGDVVAYLESAQMMASGNAPFATFNLYAPLAYYTFAAVYALSPTIFSFKFLFILIDSLIPIVIFYMTSRQLSRTKSLFIALLYVINPISLIEIGWSGHFDPLSTFFLLLAFYCLSTDKSSLSGFFLALSVLTKWYPLFTLPLFIWQVHKRDNRSTLKFIVSLSTVLILGFIPLLLMFPQQFWLSLGKLITGGGNIFYSTSISNNLYKTLIELVPTFPDIRPLIQWGFYGFSGGITILYILNKNIKKIGYVILISGFSILSGIILVRNLLSILLGLGNAVDPLTRAYTLFFALLSLIFLILLLKAIWHIQEDKIKLNSFITLQLLVMMLGLPFLAPWYFLWVLPFILMSEDDFNRKYLLAVLLFIQPFAYQNKL